MTDIVSHAFSLLMINVGRKRYATSFTPYFFAYPCPASPFKAQKCGCTDCSFCAGKKPCVDLVEEQQYHHYMYLESKGKWYAIFTF